MSRRVHYGYIDKGYSLDPDGLLMIGCLLGKWIDDESIKHYEFTTVEKKITCRACRKHIDESNEDARLYKEIHG